MGTIYQNGILYSGSTGQSYSDMGGATSTTAGVHGLVPAPSAGDQAKVLKGDGTWKSVNYSEVADTPTLGTAAAKNFTTSVTSGSSDLVTSGAVHTAIDNLPNPMVFKGTLGTNGTITSLPTAGSANEGFTYKVITAATYSGTAAKVGDVFVSNGSAWILIPAGDDVEDSWRNIKVNGTEKLGTAISSGAVDFANGTNTTVSFDTIGNKVSVSATDEKVTQTSLNDDNPYEILLSGTADNTTRTEGTNKSNRAIFNPMNVSLTFGSRQSGDTEGYYSFAFGDGISATGYFAFAEGSGTSVVGEGSHAEGMNTYAFGSASHAEGSSTSATGNWSHSEGNHNTASGEASHAEGYGTEASGNNSHAEGKTTTANSLASHAEGTNTTASGQMSHAEGSGSMASGSHSHAEGASTIANHYAQHTFGAYNVADPSTAAAASKGNYVEIVGNGTADNARSNARTLDWSGNEMLAGSLSLAGASSDITLSGTGNTWDGVNTSLKDAFEDTRPIKTASGNPIEISDGANAPLVKCVTQITGYQSGTGTPSPDNVRPITAYTEGEIEVDSGNLANWTLTPYAGAPPTELKKGTYTISISAPIGSNNWYISAQKSDTTYCTKEELGVSNFFDSSTAGVYYGGLNSRYFTFTIPEDGVIVKIGSPGGHGQKIMLERGSVAHNYIPYVTPTTHTTTYPSAIYRGSEDVVKGEVTTQKIKWTRNSSTMNNNESYPGWKDSGIADLIGHGKNERITTIMSVGSQFAVNTLGNNNTLFLPQDTYGLTQTEWIALAVDIDIVIELSTPTTETITPTNLPVKSLNGYSHIESSTGEMEIEYITEGEQAIVDLIERSVQHSFDTKVYGIHISGSESDPSAKVTYLADAVGMTPAHMNFTTGEFDYGSWGDTFIIKGIRPCILQPYLYDSGTSMYRTRLIGYLNPNNYDQTLNGDPITWGSIDNMYPGYSVMIEFPKIWYKVVPDASGDGASIYFSNHKVDAGYKDYAYIDYQGEHKEHFYMSAYNGCLNDGKLRSNSGEAVMKNYTAAQEIAYAQANNAPGWYIEDAGEIMLINFLLFLIGKSTDTQAVFGQGLNSGGTEAINDNFRTGIHNAKGLFYGTNSGTIADGSYGNAVKVFGMENYWGFQWRRYAGDILLNGTRLSKLCWGTEDGSTTNSFNLTGDGYVNIGATPSGTSGSYISAMKFTSNGMYSSVSSGTSTTHYCDGQWYNNGITVVALRGGYSSNGALVGASYVALNVDAGNHGWYLGAAPSFK